MTRVCLVGSEDVDLRTELLAGETSREALATYELERPYENTVVVDTVSLGAAVALCNDLGWYLTRFTDAVLIREPSVHSREWLSRRLAIAIRNDRIDPDETGDLLKIYGVERSSPAEPGRLVEPLYARRLDDEVPEYDLRDVEETVVVRITDAEFG